MTAPHADPDDGGQTPLRVAVVALNSSLGDAAVFELVRKDLAENMERALLTTQADDAAFDARRTIEGGSPLHAVLHTASQEAPARIAAGATSATPWP